MMKETEIPIHKQAPHHLEAERAILGGAILENYAINSILDIITVRDFYSEFHRKIFSAMIDLYDANEPIDLITLSNKLGDAKNLAQAGGIAYIASLVDNVPSAANLVHWAKIVREKAVFRGLISTATDILTKCYDTNADVDQLLDEAEHSIFEIAEKKIKSPFSPLREVIKESFKSIESLYERKEAVTGVATGFSRLDDLTSGLQRSDLIIVAGRPSMGKTAFALNIAQNAALDYGARVAVFSLEMSKEQLSMRMLASEARVDSQRLRKGLLGEMDWPKLTTAAGRLSDAAIFIDDTPAIQILEMKAKARRLKAQGGLDMIVVDYIQLMRSSYNRDSREQEISEISRSLKALAKELSVPVIALSQLNRELEKRTNRRPQMADLRESGAIEQDADVIIFIYRDEVYNKSETNPDRGIAEIIVGKQRNGPQGTVKLTFLDRYTCFENLAMLVGDS